MNLAERGPEVGCVPYRGPSRSRDEHRRRWDV